MTFAPPESAQPFSYKLRRWSASGHMTPLIIGILSVGLALGSYEHTRGNLHRLREKVDIGPSLPVQILGPGGQDPVQLVRVTNQNGSAPEFVSATLLPGRGLNLWQLTAFLPGKGNVPLLLVPKDTDLNSIFTGSGTDSNGSSSTEYGGAFQAPWAAQLVGFPAPNTGMLQTQWRGQRLVFPASAVGSTISTEGLLLNRGADVVKTSVIPDGRSATATFHAGTFSGDWAASTDLTIQVELTGHALDLTMTATNVGNVPEPFGMGWHPYFVIPGNDRANTMLVIPSTGRAAPPDRRSGISTGEVIPTTGTAYDFTKATGTPLGETSLDETYLNLHAPLLGGGPIAELRDPAANYGLRVTPLSGNVKTLRVIAPSNKSWVSIEPNMNVPDPFGSEWDHLDTTGLIILQPGDTVTWKVRVEIFSLTHSSSNFAP